MTECECAPLRLHYEGITRAFRMRYDSYASTTSKINLLWNIDCHSASFRQQCVQTQLEPYQSILGSSSVSPATGSRCVLRVCRNAGNSMWTAPAALPAASGTLHRPTHPCRMRSNPED